MSWGAVLSAGTSLLGGYLANRSRENVAEESAQLQREFAQNGISWKVADAKRAGIHPLYAMGNQGIAFQPSMWSGDGIADGLAAAGQDIGRAIDSTRTSDDKVQARLNALMVERGELQNEVLRSQLARLQQQPTPPMADPSPGLIPGQADVPNRLGLTVKEITQEPMQRTQSHAVDTHSEPGAINSLGWAKTPTGLVPVPSKDVKERIEDMAIPELMWGVQNSLLPNFGAGTKPPKNMLPDGAIGWQWSYTKQEWQPIYFGKGTKFKNGEAVSGPNKP